MIPWPVIVGIMAAFTMTVGNVAAVAQTDIKRLLAYSSIAHAGYMLLAFVSVSEQGLEGLLFYLVVYLLMNFGAWATAIAVTTELGTTEIKAWRGLGYRNPWAAVAMAIFVFSLTGLPPLAGFIGKFYIFYAVIARGGFWMLALGVLGVLNSVVSLYYYAYIAKTMFFEQPEEGASEPLQLNRLFVGMQWVFAVPTVLLGVYWAPLYEWVKASVKLLV
jgi:NADH-quinone oxidoreductase subunit N